MRQLKLSSPHARHLLPPSLTLFFIIMLSINNTTAAATPPPTTTASLHANSQHRNEALQIDNSAKVGHSGDVHLEHLMGLEQSCEDGDEECLKRRLMSEANLDYIYTQHHNP